MPQQVKEKRPLKKVAEAEILNIRFWWQACKTSKAGVKPGPKPLHRRVKPAKPNGFI